MRSFDWIPLLPSVYLLIHDKMDQAFPLCFCILQTIENWAVGRPGNEPIPTLLLKCLFILPIDVFISLWMWWLSGKFLVTRNFISLSFQCFLQSKVWDNKNKVILFWSLCRCMTPSYGQDSYVLFHWCACLLLGMTLQTPHWMHVSVCS